MLGHVIFKRDVERLRADTRAVAGDLKALLADTGGLADEQLTAVRGAAELRIRRTLERLDDLQEGLEAHVERAIESADGYASRHPWELAAAASLAAAAVGVALGLMLRQR